MPFDTAILGRDFGPHRFTYDWKSAALHALACGAGPAELDLLLESRGPRVLNSFAAAASWQPMLEAVLAFGGNLLTLLHGAQRCVAHRPLPPEGTLLVTARVDSVYDKGKGALAIFRTRATDEGGAPVFEQEAQIYYRGEGGFGGPRGPDAPPHEPPPRAADHRQELKTQETQALLYRIASGDLNPLHADPEIAAMAGFPRPILHGLCSFGHAERAAALALCGGDPGRIESIEGRFAKPLFPGETLVVELWRTGDRAALFRAGALERGEPVITLGRVTLR